MNTHGSIDIDAPASVVWAVFSDVERWHEWTASIERIVALDGPTIEFDKRFEIKQPRFPTLVWTVTAVEPGVSWTWVQRSPGGTTYATHEIEPRGDESTVVTQRIDQRGPLGVLVGLFTRRLTHRYLDLEARGLKARSEEQHRTDGAAT